MTHVMILQWLARVKSVVFAHKMVFVSEILLVTKTLSVH